MSTYSETIDHTSATVILTERGDGTIRIEAVGRREYVAALGGDLEYMPAPLDIVDDLGGEREARPGDAGCLAESYSTAAGGDKRSVWLGANPAGIAGNLRGTRALTGWRGTTDDRAVIAHGWRRVISIEPRKRGIGWVAILSRDLGGPDAVKDAARLFASIGGKAKSPAKSAAARKNVAAARAAIDPEKRAKAVAASNRRRAKK